MMMVNMKEALNANSKEKSALQTPYSSVAITLIICIVDIIIIDTINYKIRRRIEE